MGDRDNGPGKLAQISLEPGDRLGVEVVGRLVEQKHVGFFEEEPAQGHSPPLSAGQRIYVRVRRRNAEGIQSRPGGPSPTH